MELWAAFMIGVIGSFHCVGMCGPIAMAIPLKSKTVSGRIVGSLIYNLGRVFTYSIFGFIFGLLGKGIVLAGVQQNLSIAIGVIIILSVIAPFLFKKSNNFITSFSSKIVGKIKGRFGQLFQKNSLSALFLIGFFNGFLPCGLVYLGIAGAIATGSAGMGALYMALFGIGTFPFMVTIPIFSNQISLNIRNKIKRLVPFIVIIFGILFILRGLNLGIPYLSPQFSNDKTEIKSCCSTPK